MNPLIQCKTTILPLLIAGVLACFGLLPKADAVVPAPDGGYPGFNTAEGQNALFSLTTGQGNTAVGWLSLRALTQGSFNTAIGAGTLLANTGVQNTATGAAALLLNTTGSSNTAVGSKTLLSNTTGNLNTASGVEALENNTIGSGNIATGFQALFSNTTGSSNTAIGGGALGNNTTGLGNTALGVNAGIGVTTASGVTCIGAAVGGGNFDNTTWIANVFGVTTQSGTTAPVIVSNDGQLGTVVSSERFKKDIAAMNNASDAILSLRPVTFHYKTDAGNTQQFGLIAEEVAKVNPELVLLDKEGKPYTVRYDAVNAMLLNEFLKEHKAFVEEHRTVQELKKQIEALTAGLQKVSAQLEASKPAPQVVKNND